MLPSINRLNITSFNLNKNKITKIENEDITLYYKKGDKVFKAAAQISKKVAKLAVDRNRIRRLIAEALKDIKIEGEFLFKVKKNLSKQNKREIEKTVKVIFKKLNEKTG